MSKAYDIILQQILTMLDSGTVPWDRPWLTVKGRVQQSVHGRPYRGINALLTEWVAATKGYEDPRWITFNQASKLGGAPRKGEKSLAVTLWKPTERKFTDENGNEDTKSSLYLTYYRVFNVEQCDGLDLKPYEPEVLPDEWSALDECEAILYGYLIEGGGPCLEHGGNQAYYAPMRDVIRMPQRRQFPTPEAYYATAFHEAAHSTGHVSRLRRRGIESVAAFGSEVYSQEELVAELGSAFVCGEAGISNVVIERSAAYIDNWRQKLSDDPKLIIQAAGQAQKAADLILQHRYQNTVINGGY